MADAPAITATLALEGAFDLTGRPLISAFKQALINLDAAVASERAADALERDAPDYWDIIAEAEGNWNDVRSALLRILEMHPRDAAERQLQALVLQMRMLLGTEDRVRFLAYVEYLAEHGHIYAGSAPGLVGITQCRLALACEILAEDLSGLPLFSGDAWSETPMGGDFQP